MHQLHQKTTALNREFAVKLQYSTCHMTISQKKTAVKKNIPSSLQLSFYSIEIN